MDEQVIGLIVFAVIAAVSGLAKLQEHRKEEEARKQRSANRPSVEDLPEATRRMLYGDSTPPVARRRGEGMPTPPVAIPRAEVPRPAPQRRPVPQRQQEIPVAPPRQAPPQQRPYAPSAPRPIAQPLPQRQDWRGTPAQPAPQRPMPDPRQTTVSASERELERQRAIAEAARQDAVYRSTNAEKGPVAKQPARMSQAQLFRSLARNKNALRASMITMEVMGTPKGLRG